MITLRQLRYFDAFARHLHFGRDAEAVAVSKPALSIQVRELEATPGIALVERPLPRRSAPASWRLQTSLRSRFLRPRSTRIFAPGSAPMPERSVLP